MVLTPARVNIWIRGLRFEPKTYAPNKFIRKLFGVLNTHTTDNKSAPHFSFGIIPWIYSSLWNLTGKRDVSIKANPGIPPKCYTEPKALNIFVGQPVYPWEQSKDNLGNKGRCQSFHKVSTRLIKCNQCYLTDYRYIIYQPLTQNKNHCQIFMYLKINLVANNINQDKRKTLQIYILLKNWKIGVQEWLEPGSSRVSIGLDSHLLHYNSDKLFYFKLLRMNPTNSLSLAAYMPNNGIGKRASSLMTPAER